MVTFLAPTRSACRVYPHLGVLTHKEQAFAWAVLFLAVCPHMGQAFEV